MRVPRYWSKSVCTVEDPKGKALRFEAWGWSSESAEEAAAKGQQRARAAADRFLAGDESARAAEYDYLETPLREEVVETLGPAEKPLGSVTRNRYGALILNTDAVLFADVDDPPARSRGFFDALRLAFSARLRQERTDEAREASLESVRRWIAAHPDARVRLYRTAAGLRLLFTGRLYQPASPDTLALLQELGSDALYIRLTRKQESFRARLTPKPWRCGVARYPVRFPFQRDADARLARNWLDDYQRKTAGCRVCRLLVAPPDEPADPAIRAVVEYHDKMTLQPPTGRLA